MLDYIQITSVCYTSTRFGQVQVHKPPRKILDALDYRFGTMITMTNIIVLPVLVSLRLVLPDTHTKKTFFIITWSRDIKELFLI